MLEIATASLVLDPRYNGPPSTANGGYACGAIGELVDGPAEVTLLSPPPLGVPLDISFYEEGEVEARYDGSVVARARPVDRVDAHPPVRPTLAEAREASRRHPGHGRATLFSDCFVCGSARHDGLGIHFGPLRGHPGVTASVFLPDATVPNRGGVVSPDMVWAALDCPSYTPRLWDWEHPSLLARLAVERLDCVEVGEPAIALGWHVGSQGRKHHTASALLSVDGRVLARGRALWITLASSPR
jgi:hypothetical protein